MLMLPLSYPKTRFILYIFCEVRRSQCSCDCVASNVVHVVSVSTAQRVPRCADSKLIEAWAMALLRFAS